MHKSYFFGFLVILFSPFSVAMAMEKIGRALTIGDEKREYTSQEERRIKLQSQGALYDLDEADCNIPLTRENVIDPYPFWHSMENKPQAEKDAALNAILEFFHGDNRYYLKRLIVAGSVLGGANPNTWEYKHLWLTVQYGDLELARLLLKHKADPCSESIYDRPCIFEAKTEAMALLLIAAGAKVDPDRDFTLLHQSMHDDCEPGLVTVYRNNGVSPFAVYRKYKFGLGYRNTGDTPLHLLSKMIRFGNDINQIIGKSTRLFDGLSPVQTTRLCTMRNHKDKTALDILHSKIDINWLILGHPNAEKLLEWLKNKLSDAERQQEASRILSGKRERG
jgi:hypothetical protein